MSRAPSTKSTERVDHAVAKIKKLPKNRNVSVRTGKYNCHKCGYETRALADALIHSTAFHGPWPASPDGTFVNCLGEQDRGVGGRVSDEASAAGIRRIK